MSLDTLLEAAKYLDHIERTDSSDGERHDSIGNDSFEDSDEAVLPSSTYHLKVDPNLPISVQFHTYTSCGAGLGGLAGLQALQPMTHLGQSVGSGVVTKNCNSSTKANSHRNVRNVTNLRNNTSNIRTTINSINSMINQNFNINSLDSSGKDSGGHNHNHNHNKTVHTQDHSSYSRHREMHKTLEKNRRAHLRHCFEVLKEELPPNEYNEKKSSHINIISCAIRYIHVLKRTESDLQSQTERLVRTKMRFQSQIAQLKDDLKHVDTRPHLGHNLLSHASTQSSLQLSEECLEFEPQIDEQSDEEVMIELESGEQAYDDETTTTASECAECADDMPSKATSQPSLATALIYKCQA